MHAQNNTLYTNLYLSYDMKRKFTYLLLFIICATSLWGSNASNVRVKQMDKDIVITYDLKKTSNVRLLMSIDGGAFRLVRATSGAIGRNVRAGNNLTIVWHPLKEQEKFIASNVRFKVEAFNEYELYSSLSAPNQSIITTYVLGTYAYGFSPQSSFGFTIGQAYNGFGWFVDFRSNWNFKHLSGFTRVVDDMNAPLDYGGGPTWPFYTGESEVSHMVLHAGFAYYHPLGDNRFTNIGAYLGLGAGMRNRVIRTADDEWCLFKPNSYSGFTGNMGVILSVYGLTLRAGVNTIMFKYLEIEAGLGWMF